MNLKKLQQLIHEYKIHLTTDARYEHLYKWESMRVWQEHWDLDRLDLAAMFDESLQNTQSRRLWVGSDYHPKSMMLEFIKLQREFVRSMFRDLLDENRGVDGRVDRFIFHCGELLEEFRTSYPVRRENSHYHGSRTVSLYLAFAFPERYTLYESQPFRQMMLRLDSPNVPTVDDLERFFRVMRTIQGFLDKDEDIMRLHTERLDTDKHYLGRNLLQAHELCVVCGSSSDH
jgi:5-methylcytosine-specific restriction protein B